MIPPRDTVLICTAEDGSEFVGKRDSIFCVLGMMSKYRGESDIYAVRWFSLEGNKWLPCKPPASWRRLKVANEVEGMLK